MKLYANEITEKEIMDAAIAAGVTVEKLISKPSRNYVRSFDVILSGSGPRRSQWRDQEVPAATWDEWGIFLARLFDHEPGMRAAAYRDRDHFRWATANRYDTLTPADQHRLHAWRVDHHVLRVELVRSCKRCPAVQRIDLQKRS
jgi:hypothetical protein